ncbi:hypothetical protein P6166_14365 [Stenotrophomonas sp. HITSZ_GD]|uniref:hypothetical protein n=1 Tax=Stenotrophomonas sp. HITSZ_GD TaxID=3037248 RepID=UPI00240D2848|nr:hypothetical protein [Stenotrophomonas sp. HITSZ_GD]MDG2526537.1 hypothetical protein [Stenotrophomonas sp. HITSZ_GD]
MSTRVPTLEDLQRQLVDLRAALADEDDARAAELVREHDVDLRQYLAAHGTGARLALGELLRQQAEAMDDMRARRDAAGSALRQNRRSSDAARAYLRAGAL